MINNKIESLIVENYKLKRRLMEAERGISKRHHVYQYWTHEDWEKVYGKTDHEA